MLMVLMSDIHGNIEALEAVLEVVDGMNPDEIICLGDTIGYGPNPSECFDIAMERFSITLMGNHEDAILNGAKYFNPAGSALSMSKCSQ